MQLRHALLGLLDLAPQSGYDLHRAFAGSVRHFWHADQSQIYRTLDRMEADGAIRTTPIPQTGKPDRRVHELTDAGRTELHAWLAGPLDDERPKEPFLARLFFAADLGVDGVLRLLDQREREVHETLARLRAITGHDGDLRATLQSATLAAGIIAADAELAWVAATRRNVEAHR